MVTPPSTPFPVAPRRRRPPGKPQSGWCGSSRFTRTLTRSSVAPWRPVRGDSSMMRQSCGHLALPVRVTCRFSFRRPPSSSRARDKDSGTWVPRSRPHHSLSSRARFASRVRRTAVMSTGDGVVAFVRVFASREHAWTCVASVLSPPRVCFCKSQPRRTGTGIQRAAHTVHVEPTGEVRGLQHLLENSVNSLPMPEQRLACMHAVLVPAHHNAVPTRHRSHMLACLLAARFPPSPSSAR
ncbi:hypothetical protein BD414DRAFT_66044 [Trametes punicea]|nr:hypothetical protein BD414DRAFT_66044 [Trametes punicea]